MGAYIARLRKISIKIVAIYHLLLLLRFHKNGLLVVSFEYNGNIFGINDISIPLVYK